MTTNEHSVKETFQSVGYSRRWDYNRQLARRSRKHVFSRIYIDMAMI